MAQGCLRASHCFQAPLCDCKRRLLQNDGCQTQPVYRHQVRGGHPHALPVISTALTAQGAPAQPHGYLWAWGALGLHWVGVLGLGSAFQWGEWLREDRGHQADPALPGSRQPEAQHCTAGRGCHSPCPHPCPHPCLPPPAPPLSPCPHASTWTTADRGTRGAYRLRWLNEAEQHGGISATSPHLHGDSEGGSCMCMGLLCCAASQCGLVMLHASSLGVQWW